MSFSALK